MVQDHAPQPDAGAAGELERVESLAHALAREQKWARAGEALSVINVNDKIIEEKERELLDCIAQNYSRIKGVERELAGLQLQLRLTSGPKKSALELLRRKIELQTEHVVAARGKYQAARKLMEAAEEALKAEEAAKDRLCQELNLLVQQSAHAQLERLEQLTKRMELLNKGYVPDGEQPAPAPAPIEAEPAAGHCREPAGAAEPSDSSAGAPTPATPEKQPPPPEAASSGAPPSASPRRPELSAADRERAAAARARHVGLRPAARPQPARPAPAARTPAAGQPFRGFD